MRRREVWPERASPGQYQDALGRYTLLTAAVFEQEWGLDWYTIRTAKAHSTVDLSGEQFNLESLAGDPEQGLLHPGIHQDLIEVLNISKNNLTDIGCLNHKIDGRYAFKKLTTLNASRNMLMGVHLELKSITMLNLSHNELVRLPNFSQLHELQKLILSHNRLDGALQELGCNSKLWYLDLSSNQFSWKPSLFKEQVDVMVNLTIVELKLWPNPFAEHFKEYQFLTVTAIDSLTGLDGFHIDSELRAELRIEADKLRAKGVDYSVFDIKVEDKKRSGVAVEDSGADIVGSNVPRMAELIDVLNRMLDRPGELHRSVTELEEKIKGVWGAHFRDRQQLTELLASPQERAVGMPHSRQMNTEEEQEVVSEFADKMQQVLDRFDSVQDVLVISLVRLLASGRDLLSCRCATLLAEWVDASAPELQGRVQEMSDALFKDLRLRTLSGMQSINESPFECYEASHGRRGGLGHPDSIAECACILRALSHFGSSALYAKANSPFRALVLRPFLRALCREAHRTRGPDQPVDEWATYQGFDAFPDEVAEFVEGQDASSLALCQQRCVRHGHGGFVMEEPLDQQGQPRVMFKSAAPDALVGLRRTHPGRTLHVRPTKAPQLRRRPPDASEEHCEAWSAWVSGLAVLVVATADRQNAAYCISALGIHQAIIRHDSDASAGFTEAWMLVTDEASRAFVILLQLAQNIAQAARPAGHEAVRYFTEHKLHTSCWKRARRRLMENGAAIPMGRLNDSNPDLTTLISSLVAVVCTMVQAGTPDVADAIMTELKDTGLDVFYLLLEVAAFPGTPDPVLLASSLEAVYVFIDSNVTRPQVLSRVLSRLHDSASLLPYIKGPTMKEAHNLKYQDLWRTCMVKYVAPDSAEECMPELFGGSDYTTQGAYSGQAGREDGQGQWRSRVPQLKDLQHPLMHRVLLAIVKLIKLFSLKAQNDETGLLRNVATLLDKQGRERLLIGPATGLVLCPDYDIKIQCLQCMGHVLLTSAWQLSEEEMGWLLQYLTPVGIGVGKQEEFIMEIVDLMILLVRDQTSAGATFRQKFAKLAVREAFEMLRVNCRREVNGTEEELSKLEVGEKIIQLLQACSRPHSGGLRKFLRRVDLLECLKEILHHEDNNDRRSVRGPLLSTWTGRSVREVLLPLSSDSRLRPRGLGKYRSLVRLADVLQGRNDYEPGDTFSQVPSSDELEFWPSARRLQHGLLEHDPQEREDWRTQQQEFVSADGLECLVHVVEKYLSGGEGVLVNLESAQRTVEAFASSVQESARRWWENRPKDAEDPRPQAEGVQALEQPLSPVEERFVLRLRTVNLRVSQLYGFNLNAYDEKRGSSLVRLASFFAKHFEENHRRDRQQYDEYQDAYEALLSRPNEYFVGGKLMSIAAVLKKGLRLEKPRQPHGDLHRLLQQAAAAQLVLKAAVIARPPNNDAVTDEWARATLDPGKGDPPRRVSKGLADFLRNHDAQVVDPGPLQEQVLQRRHTYKYFNDNTRLRNIARLLVEYPDVERLGASLKELSHTNRFAVVKIRNCFARPTNFGRRSIIVSVEVQLADCKHLCELELSVRPQADSNLDTLARRSMLMDTLAKTLRDSCQVKPKHAAQVAEYLTYELESRSIRHGDAIILGYGDKHLEVQKEEIFAQSGDFSTGKVFYIEREAGFGVVKAGDVVSLRSKASNKYLDIASNGVLRCRFGDAMTQSSNLRFVLELDYHEQPCSLGGVADQGGLARWFDAEGAEGAEGRALRAQPGVPPSNVHSENRVRLKARASPRYVTVLPATTYLGLSGEKLRVKGQPKEERFVEGQLLAVFREGSLAEDLRLHGGEGEGPGMSAGLRTPEEKLEQCLLEAHMCSALPSHDACPREGGVFRRAPPAFKVVAQRQAEGRPPAAVETSLEIERSRLAPVLAAVFRCAYVLVELPCSVHTQSYALDEVLGTLQHTGVAARLLTVALATQNVLRSDELEEPDIVRAWMPAKLLRLFSAALADAPALSVPSCRRARNGGGGQDRAERRLEERGEYDQQRLVFMHMLSTYMSQVLVQPLLARLDLVVHRPLDLQEVVLLREFATAIERIVFGFFANEFRCANEQSQEGTVMGALGNAETALLGAVASGPALGTLAMVPSTQPLGTDQAPWSARGRGGRLSKETRGEIFASLVPATTTRVLVQALLYGVHQEAIAFTSGFRGLDVNVRLISSLVNRSIGALAAVMHGRSASEDTACEYHVCEAISQAMSNGAQLVPRARITQLMQERATDALRSVLQEKLEHGFSLMDSLPATIRMTECILTVAHAWAGPAEDDENQGQLPRRLVAITSRLNLMVLRPVHSLAGGGAPSQRAEFAVLSCCDLRRLRRVVVSPRMRQFLGLWWDEGSDSRREVLIFESSSRRRTFQQALRMVERRQKQSAPSSGSEPGSEWSRGIPEVQIRKEVFVCLREACKKDMRNNTSIVNVTFARSRKEQGASSWGGSWGTPESSDGDAELLVLTVDTVAAIELPSFLRQYAKWDDLDDYAVEARHGTVMETDSEGEEDLVGQPPPPQPFDGAVACQALHGSPWPLKQLEGVWFLAEAEPKMKLQFERPELMLFTSDGERQRWRRHLAATLACQERRRAGEQAKGGQGWSVVPTGKTELAEVKKYAFARAQSPQRALMDGSKAAG